MRGGTPSGRYAYCHQVAFSPPSALASAKVSIVSSLAFDLKSVWPQSKAGTAMVEEYDPGLFQDGEDPGEGFGPGFDWTLELLHALDCAESHFGFL
jgi:hypothetical protein